MPLERIKPTDEVVPPPGPMYLPVIPLIIVKFSILTETLSEYGSKSKIYWFLSASKIEVSLFIPTMVKLTSGFKLSKVFPSPFKVPFV